MCVLLKSDIKAILIHYNKYLYYIISSKLLEFKSKVLEHMRYRFGIGLGKYCVTLELHNRKCLFRAKDSGSSTSSSVHTKMHG